MDGPTLALAILAALLTTLAVYVMFAYNRLVRLRQLVENALSQIDIQLTRRHGLIPNLVATVRKYMEHEHNLLDEVTRARSEAVRLLARLPGFDDAAGAAALSNAESALTTSLGKLVAIVEAYPTLQASDQAARLMEELASAENRVAFARQHYNDSAMRYTTLCESFPAMLVAGVFGFSKAAYLEFDNLTTTTAVALTKSAQG